jgi:hypothetical protein
VVLRRPEIDAPIGAVGLLAPALTDSLHPSFYMAMLILGTRAKQVWGVALRPLTTRFQYGLLDEPELARFYPRLHPKSPGGPEELRRAFDRMAGDLLEMMVTPEIYAEYRHNLLWMLGGPMGRAVLASVRSDPAALNFLNVSIASRALWGSEEFWAEYRDRFGAPDSPDFLSWGEWLLDPAHRVRLLLVPQR